MPDNPEFLYWDADVILNFLNKDPRYHAILINLIHEVKQSGGKTKIITSVLSQAEVLYIQEGNIVNTSQDAIDKIDRFFLDRSIIELVGINEQVIAITRRLKLDFKKKGNRLKLPDTIHLATASWMHAAVFHTYNMDDFPKVASFVPFPIEEPSVSQNNLFPINPPSQ